ncbi:uncharacterized protein LOC134266849 [Saccostrea cucullata]|uniref:uncharacterized protein LOC134266849 n=1 Tax=Saccostrea cuccullata TaxID=36930 RepID=UPI002ED48A7E
MQKISIFLLVSASYFSSTILGQNFFGSENTIGDVLGRQLSEGSAVTPTATVLPATQTVQNPLGRVQSTSNVFSPLGRNGLWTYDPYRFSSWNPRFGGLYDNDYDDYFDNRFNRFSNRYSGRGLRRYLRNLRRRSNRFDSDESGERRNSWTNLYRSMNRRRRRFGSNSDSSNESGERRWGIYNRYNRRGRFGSDSNERWGSGERRRGIFNRSYFGRRWRDSSEENSGERFRSPYYPYRYRRRGSGSNERFGRWSRYRNPYYRDDSDERDGLYRNRFRNYRNVISRLNSRNSFNSPYYRRYNPNRLSLFGGNWNRYRW